MIGMIFTGNEIGPLIVAVIPIYMVHICCPPQWFFHGALHHNDVFRNDTAPCATMMSWDPN